MKNKIDLYGALQIRMSTVYPENIFNMDVFEHGFTSIQNDLHFFFKFRLTRVFYAVNILRIKLCVKFSSKLLFIFQCPKCRVSIKSNQMCSSQWKISCINRPKLNQQILQYDRELRAKCINQCSKFLSNQNIECPNAYE